MIDVCHVITGINSGGAETALCRLLEALSQPPFRHRVIVLMGHGDLSARAESVADVRYLNMQRGKALPDDVFRLRACLDECGPSVVHAWMHHANFLATFASWRRSWPLIWGVRQSLHGFASERFGTRLTIRANALLSKRASRIVFNSEVSAAQHAQIGFYAGRNVVIPNGFDTDVFAPDRDARVSIRRALGIPPSALVVGIVARVHPVKDHVTFLRAAEKFAQWFPATYFVLVGQGATRENEALAALVTRTGLGDRVKLCGRRDDIQLVNNAFDIATLSSVSEAFPNAIAEAMACGVPCVGTEVGAMREIIGDTGVVVRASDPDALCMGWKVLADIGDAGRARLGTDARQRVMGRFSIAEVAKRYAMLYLSMAESSRSCVA